MATNDLLEHLQYIIVSSKNGQAPDDRAQAALGALLDWLAERVPFKTPLPRGYSLLWSVKTDKQGNTLRYHQLLRAASGSTVGVWIDTQNLDQVEPRDFQVFAQDLATGFLKDLIAFLQNNQ